MTQDKDAAPGLPPRIVKLLLDKLETDEAFREAFAKSPADALRALGHAKASPACLALKPGATLASPAQIRAQRAKLEKTMTLPHTYDCALAHQEGY